MRWRFWLWSRLLLLLDQLLGTRLVEWELCRRQRRVEQLVAELEAVNRELDVLSEERAIRSLALCLVELKARSQREDIEDWLQFVPHTDGEEELLDKAIEYLVKPRLAGIDVEPTETGQYAYRLHPNWAAILARMRKQSVAPELKAWLEDRL